MRRIRLRNVFRIANGALRISRQAFTLVELMVALGIIVAGLLASFALLSSSIGLQRVVADRLTATYLAGEGVEIVKNFIDTNVLRSGAGCAWNGGEGCIAISSGTYEVDYASTSLAPSEGRRLFRDRATGLFGFNSLGEAEATPFTRRVVIDLSPDGEEMRVSSIVAWSVRGGNYEINAEDHFYNWR